MTAPESPNRVSGRDVAEQLEPLLTELIALALNGKQAHWHLYGRQFSPLHEKLDEVVSEARTYADEIAERLVALGVPVDGRPQAVAQASPDFPEGFVSDDKVLALIVEQLDALIDRTRETLGPLESIDLASQDIALELLRVLEKRRWMLAAFQNTEASKR
ncbi:DNA starvation/stationary phase protection protein [Actinobacteria bacterium YIM 96077]|uniref:DNA starvation/stationary phase protection protein n=1 Tax=Phytoactinopolyspora halophila TaxID=1981511 RepID=A0A329QDJ6_9ACTN|nr:DNA starvation/stationary phase protection protein [Phytoactinopolyspora halophila]AYY12471.1 DNA starvation/stationary phase protection protein [Actinobacteria bacterium YIM 96077]RAW09332.1 DNA starvation/stationary phase protection protein [Phytoactinopolyspora halophila]